MNYPDLSAALRELGNIIDDQRRAGLNPYDSLEYVRHVLNDIRAAADIIGESSDGGQPR